MRAWAVLTAGALLVFARVFGMSVVLVDFRTYAAGLGAGAFWAGVALGAYALTLALMQVPFGMLSDRLGRRPVLLLASLLFVAGSLWAAVADSVWALIAARLLQGTGAVSSVALAMVGESLPSGRRTIGMAIVGISAGGGFMLGLLAGPLISPLIGVPGLFVLVAAVGLAAAVPLAWVQPGPIAEDLGHPGSVDRRSFALALGGFTANFALLAVMFHISEAGASVVPLLVIALVVMLAVSGMADRRGWGWRPLYVTLPTLAVGAPLLVLLQGPAAWIGGAAFFAAHATLSAVLPSQVSKASGQRGGRGHGIQSLLAHPGSFLGATAAGAMAAAGAGWAVFALLGVLVAAALSTLLAARPRAAPA